MKSWQRALFLAGVVAVGMGADGGAGLPGTLVSLHYEKGAAGKVLDDLFGQMKLSYQTSPEMTAEWPQVTIDAEKRPYWEVVAKLDDAMGVTIHLWEGGKMMVNRRALEEFDPERGVRCISGPCMLVARSVAGRVDFTQQVPLERYEVQVTMLVEPQVKVVLYSKRVDPEVAVDELGNSLVGEKGKQLEMTAVKDNTYNEFSVSLVKGEKAGSRIAELKGTAHLMVVEAAVRVEVAAADFAAMKKMEFKGAAVTVGPIKPEKENGSTGTSYRAMVKVERNGLGDAEWAEVCQSVEAMRISILDAQGKAYHEGGGGRGSSTSSRSVDVLLRSLDGFGDAKRDAGAAATCVVEIPGKMKDVAVVFEFKDLPLP